MTRRQAREYILQSLFQYEFTGKKPDRDEIKEGLNKKKPDENILNFIEDMIEGTIKHRKEIDRKIQSVSEHWDLKRLASVDRNILRFATYELLFRNDIPPIVTINEAIDIAKKYSTSESYSFINGLLNKIAHEKRITKD